MTSSDQEKLSTAPINNSRMALRERRLHLENMTEVARRVGQAVINYRADAVKDTSELHGHPSSTIDAFAQVTLVAAVTEVYDKSPMTRDWVINLEFEDAVALSAATTFFPTEEQKREAPVAIIDEIDGTTNVKRAVASPLGGVRPKSAVAIALKRNADSSIIEVGAVYAFDEDVTFGGILVEDEYIAVREGESISVGGCSVARGDSKQRIIAPTYSNQHHGEIAKLKESIENHVNRGKCECYDGCRSSTVDVLDIIRNQYDCYVDCRDLCTKDYKNNSVLRVYDVAAALPIARGAELRVVTPDGRDFTLEGVSGHDPVSVIIGRPRVVEEVLEAIAPLVEEFSAQKGENVAYMQ